MGHVFPCTEQGIRDAIAEGGGPHTFDCDGPTTVTTAEPIVIGQSVFLDGEGNLRIDYTSHDTLFKVNPGEGDVATVELRGLTMGGPYTFDVCAWGILNRGTLVLTNVAVQGYCLGVFNSGMLTMINATVSENDGGLDNEGTLTAANSTVSRSFLGIDNEGTATLKNSTVSDNTENAITNTGTFTLTASTVEGYGTSDYGISNDGMLTVINSLIVSDCIGDIVSGGYNIESEWDSCGFDQETDQVNVSADDLKFGPLQDNGGPTQTHALGDGSVAIDVIPEADCVDAEGEPLMTDQRGEPRPAGDGCDVGAFEVQP
jgi:hypothetical protein